MQYRHSRVLGILALLVLLSASALGQLTTGSISGTVSDQSGAVVAGAEVSIRNLETGFSRAVKTDGEGRFSFNGVPAGSYELTTQMTGFAKHVRGPIQLQLNQNAVITPVLTPAAASEIVTVTEDAPLVNTVNNEVGVRFDERRLTDLPTLSTNAGGSLRDIFSFALSAPGVSQINTNGNSAFANGPNFAANGMRIRSNNYMIDGQDSNDPSVTGRQQVMNNPDIIKEFHLITNQPTAEYGRAAGSVVSVVTKGGTNQFHGSAFWFHNDKSLNSRSNIEKGTASLGGKTPFRLENQYGGTFGGPLRRDKAFFFGSYQKWTDGNLGSGTRIDGVPTEAGRTVLQTYASRPQVAALLKFLPAAQAALSTTASFCTNGAAASATSACPNGGTRVTVPLGSLSNSTRSIFANEQSSVRFDYNFSANHIFGSRYLYSDTAQVGTGQANPPGNSTVSPSRTQAIAAWLNSTLRPTLLNEARLSWQRLASATLSANPESETIPSVEVSELGLQGFNAAGSRTAVGLAVNLPQSRRNNTYQLQDTMSWNAGGHSLKFGGDLRNVDVFSDFNPTIRGRLQYGTLDQFVNDVASSGAINQVLPGGKRYVGYRWWDHYWFVQDNWQLTPGFNLNLGLRYENPGNALEALYRLNDAVVAANGGNEAFRFKNRPGRDNNNLEPRVGFNWNPRTSQDGALGWLTGGDKTVVRGGYARTHDYQFINLALNVASAFPFQAAFSLAGSDLQGAWTKLKTQVINPATAGTTQTRTTIAPDYHSPEADQFTFEIQRGIKSNNVLRIGYVGTRGSGLFQSLDGNPVKPCALPVPSTGCPSTAPNRVDPTQAVVRLRANSAESIYHSLQVSFDRRFARGLSAGAHYTWSSFIDTASDTFNPSVAGEIAVPQNSFNIKEGERARSTYDRPQRLSTNVYYELPIYRGQPGVIGRILGGWQTSAFLTFQSGSPFTPLNGSDPSGATAGISALIGIPIRPLYNTGLNVSHMSLPELLAAGGRSLFTPITLASINAGGPRLGNVNRNVLRSDGINNLDVSFGKNIKVTEGQQIQFRADFFNLTNTRDFGIPNATVTNAGFANEKTTDGGKRRIFLSLRYSF